MPAMREASVLTPEVLELVGRRSAPVEVTISTRSVRRAMDLYLGHHDLPIDEGKPVPGYVLLALQPESEGVRVPDLLPSSLLVSNEFGLERPLTLGETLVATSTLAALNERFGGRFGYSVNARSEVEFRDSSGALVATMASTLMYYDPADANDAAEERP